jgi:exopolysaccharide production protein ExoZ
MMSNGSTPSPNADTGLERIPTIQAGRAIAAWAVVIGHVSGKLIDVSGYRPAFAEAFRYAAVLAHFGVDLFFVISGAIMFLMYGHRTAKTGPAAAVTFAMRRVLRIFPLFWITSLAMYVAGAPILDTPGFATYVSSLLLIDFPQFHLVAWTLVFEVRFYGLVLIVILLSGRRPDLGFLALCAGWMLVTFVTPRALPAGSPFTYKLVTDFVLGIAVAAAYRRRLVPPPLALAAFAVWLPVGAIVAFGAEDINEVRAWSLGVPAALILYACISRARDFHWRIPVWLQRAGDESYSVYMWHYAVIFAIAPVFTIDRSTAPALIYPAAALPLVWVVGRLSHLAIERPLLNVARSARLARIASFRR